MAYIPLTESELQPNKPARATSFALQVHRNFQAISEYGSVVPLGGSPTTAVIASGWERVPGYLPARMNAVVASGWTRQVVVLTRTLVSGESVNWRVVDDVNLPVVTGTEHSSLDWTMEIKAIAPTEDGHRYFLEVQSGNANIAVQGYGVVEQFKE